MDKCKVIKRGEFFLLRADAFEFHDTIGLCRALQDIDCEKLKQEYEESLVENTTSVVVFEHISTDVSGKIGLLRILIVMI